MEFKAQRERESLLVRREQRGPEEEEETHVLIVEGFLLYTFDRLAVSTYHILSMQKTGGAPGKTRCLFDSHVWSCV